MAIIVNGTDCHDAWINMSRLVITNGSISNALIIIDQPTNFTNLNTWIRNRNPKNINRSFDNIRHVANTIFPYGLAPYFRNRADFYNKYENIYSNGSMHSWGTYFQRLISFDNHFRNNGINQLEDAISALQGGSPQRHYIVFHLSARNLDSNKRPMGAPCWHFGELTINSDKSVNLIAVYRAQDYFNKALGNYIGLGKLLEFICRESGRDPGQLIIHAIHAYNGSTKNNLETLIR